MDKISKAGGGRFSALDSMHLPNPKLNTLSTARMLNASEMKSLRDYASGWVAVREAAGKLGPAEINAAWKKGKPAPTGA